MTEEAQPATDTVTGAVPADTGTPPAPAPVLVAKMNITTLEESHSLNDAGELVKQAERLQLFAVSGKPGSVNEQWAKWTPSGKLELTVNNPSAFGKVKPGVYKVLLVPCGKDD